MFGAQASLSDSDCSTISVPDFDTCLNQEDASIVASCSTTQSIQRDEAFTSRLQQNDKAPEPLHIGGDTVVGLRSVFFLIVTMFTGSDRLCHFRNYSSSRTAH